jgi:hypothetical protein
MKNDQSLADWSFFLSEIISCCGARFLGRAPSRCTSGCRRVLRANLSLPLTDPGVGDHAGYDPVEFTLDAGAGRDCLDEEGLTAHLDDFLAVDRTSPGARIALEVRAVRGDAAGTVLTHGVVTVEQEGGRRGGLAHGVQDELGSAVDGEGAAFGPTCRRVVHGLLGGEPRVERIAVDQRILHESGMGRLANVQSLSGHLGRGECTEVDRFELLGLHNLLQHLSETYRVDDDSIIIVIKKPGITWRVVPGASQWTPRTRTFSGWLRGVSPAT